MKLNRLIIVCIFLLAIFTLGAVSAADNMTSDELAADENIEEISSSDDVELESIADLSNDLIGDKYDSDIGLIVYDIYEGEDAHINVYGPNDTYGNVSITLNGGQSFQYPLVDGYCLATFSNLSAGNYSVFAIYWGNDDYFSSEAYSSFYVMPSNSTLAVPNMDVAVENIYVGEDEQVKVTLPEDATGSVTVYLSQYDYYTAVVVNGYATVVIPNLSSGTYNITTVYSGDNKYKSVSLINTFFVKYNPSNVTGADLAIAVNSNVSYAQTGDVISYMVIVSNKGPCNASGVGADFMLPYNLAYQYADLTNGHYDYEKGYWNIGNLAPGEVAYLDVVFQVVAEGNSTLTAQVSSYESDVNFTDNYDSNLVEVISGVTTNIVTPYTFYNFFDEYGMILDKIDFEELIFVGDFDCWNAARSIYINKPIKVDGANATFNAVSFDVLAENVVLDKLNIDCYRDGAAVSVFAPNATISNMILNCDGAAKMDVYAILVNGSQNFCLINSSVRFIGKTSEGSVTNFVRIIHSDYVCLINNTFVGSLISSYVPWTEEPAGSGNWVSYPISEAIVIESSNEVLFQNNYLNITYNNVVGSYDTIYTVDFRNVDNALISQNVIEALGHTYIYGIMISGDNFTIADNHIKMESDNYYANGIDIEGPATGVVVNNEINVKGVNSAYGIYSGMNGRDVSAEYIANLIIADAYNVFGFSSGDIGSSVIQNSISLNGNYTTGIACWGSVNILENLIICNASNVGNESIWESFGVETRGVKVIGDTFVIINNTISSADKSIDIAGANNTIQGNYLNGRVYVEGDCNAIVENIISSNDVYAVNLTDSKENIVRDNRLSAKVFNGDRAVYFTDDSNVITGNYPRYAELAVNAVNIAEGETAVIEVSVVDNATGEVIISFAGMTFQSTIMGGKATVTAPNLATGKYLVEVDYLGDENYGSSYSNASFIVYRVNNEVTSDSINGVVSGDVDVATVNPWATSGELNYFIPSQARHVKSADLYVAVYSGSAQNTYGAYAEVIIGTASGENPIAFEQLWIDDGSTDGTVYTVNGHTTKCYSDYYMHYNVTDMLQGLINSSITVNVNTFAMEGKNFDGRIKLIALVVAYDDGDNDIINYWIDSAQKWTRTNITTTFKTQDVENIVDAGLANVILSSADAVYEINGESLGNATYHEGGNYYQYNYWDLTGKVQEGTTTEISVMNAGTSSYASLKNVLTVLKMQSLVSPAQPIETEVSFATEYASVPTCYAGTVNVITINVQSNFAAEYAIELLADGTVVNTTVVALDGENTTDILLIDPTVRPIDETTVNGANNTNVNYTVIVKYGNVIVCESSKIASVVYNGYLGKDMEYNATYIEDKSVIQVTGSVVVDVKDISTYLSSSATNRTEVWSIDLDNDSTLTNAFVYISYNWDKTGTSGPVLNVTFNGNPITPKSTYRDQANLGKYGVYGYGLYVYDVSEFAHTGNNTLFIGKEKGLAALYPSSLIYFYDTTGSKVLTTAYLADGVDLLTNSYNKAGRIVKTDSKIAIDTKDVVDASLFIFAASGQSGEGNIIVNGIEYADVWSGSSNSLDLFTLNGFNFLDVNDISFVATGSTIMALNQMIVTTSYVNENVSDVTLNVIAEDIFEGENTIVTVTVPADVTGSIYLTVNDDVYSQEIVDGKCIFVISGLKAGTYSVVARYTANANATSVVNSTTLTVMPNGNATSKKYVDLIITVPEEIYEGDDAVIDIIMSVDGEVRVIVDGVSYLRYDVNIVGGSGSVTLSNLFSGNYSVEVSFNGNDDYYPATANASFIMLKKDDNQTLGNKVIFPDGNTPEAVQAAIDNATDGDTIDLSNYEEYDFGNSTVMIRASNVILKGNGSTIIKGHGANDRGRGEALIEVLASNVTVQGITFIDTHPLNDFRYAGIVYGTATAFRSVNGGLLNGCTFINWDSASIVQRSINVVLENNYIKGGYTTRIMNDPTVNMEDGSDSFKILGASSKITVRGNTFEGQLLDGVSIAQGSGDNIIENNTFIGNTYSIYLGGSSTKNSVIRNNRFINCGYFKEGDVELKELPVIDIRKASNDLAIENNVFIACENSVLIAAEQGNEAHGFPSSLENINVTGNTVTKYSEDVNASSIVLFKILSREENSLNPANPIYVIDNNVADGINVLDVIYMGSEGNISENIINDAWIVDNGYIIAPNNSSNDIYLIIESANITYGENAIITVNVPADATGSITLTVNDNNYTQEIVNGQSVFSISGLDVGVYEVIASYLGDDLYLSAQNTTVLTVSNQNGTSKRDVVLNVMAQDIVEGENATIAVAMSVDGDVSVYIGNVCYNLGIVDGKGLLAVPDLMAGEYMVIVLFEGNDEYNANNISVIFTVVENDINQTSSNLTFTVNDTYVGEDVIIEVWDYLATLVTITVDGEDYQVITDDKGYARLTIQLYSPGTYEVTVNGYMKQFSILPLTGTLIIESTNITCGEDAVITVTVPADATGSVTLTVSGMDFNQTVVNGQSIFNISGLDAGEYEVIVMYSGNEWYLPIQNSTIFNVRAGENTTSKKDVNLTVSAHDIFEGENATITVEMSVEGTVNVYFNDEEFNLTVNGQTSFGFGGLTEGEYTVSVFYMGSDKFNPANATATFIVIKNETVEATMNFTVDDIVYGQDAVVNVEYSQPVTTIISVYVDNEVYSLTIKDGKGSLPVSGLNAGEHVAVVNGTEKRFNIAKATIDMTLKVDSIVYGEETITLLLTDDLDGVVSIQIDGKTYNATIVNKEATFNVSGLDADNYELIAIYKGNDNYREVTTTLTLTVEKLNVNVDLKVDNFTYSNTETLEFDVDADITGQIRLDIGDKSYYSYVDNRKVIFNVTDLDVGNYKAVLVYAGNNNTYISNTIYNFTIKQADIDVDIDIGTLTYSKDNTVSINVPEGLTGNITVIIGNRHYTRIIDNRTMIFHIENINAGNYELTTIYEGNNNYYRKTVVYNVIVEKMNVTFDMDVNEMVYNETNKVTFNVPEAVTGTVYVRIGDDTYETIVLNGVVEVYIKNINAGNHVVRLIYAGNDNYYDSETVYNITIKQLNVPITLKQDKLVYSKHNEFTLNIPKGVTGNLSIRIGNETYTTIIDNGTATFNILNINAGNYLVEAIYAGNNNYYENHTFFNITIEKMTVAIELGVGSVSYNRNETIDLIFPDDATGNVSIEIGNKTFNTIVNNGKATFNIVNVNAGKYTATFIYDGDVNHNEYTSTVEITIEKINADITLTTPDIAYSENEEISISVPVDASGNFTLVIGNKVYTSSIHEGKAVFANLTIPAGDYIVSANYSGDVNYNAAEETFNLTISKIMSSIEVTAGDISYGDDETIDIIVCDGATGKVSVTVNGVEYTADIENSAAVINMSGLDAGTYNITAIYEGDVNYLESNATAQFTVNKVDSTLTVPDIVFDYGSSGSASVEYVGATNVTAQIDAGEVSVSGNVIVVSGLDAGSYTLTVTTVPDANHNAVTETANVTVNKVDSTLTVPAIVFDYGSSGFASVEYTGAVNFTAQIDVGKVSVSGNMIVVSGLDAGSYTLTVTTVPDANHNAVTETANVTVNKVDSSITVNDVVSDYGSQIVTTVSTVGSTGITAVCNGVNPTVIDNVIVIEGLNAGIYTLTVTTVPDANHNAVTKTATVTVNKVDSILTVEDVEMYYGNLINVTVITEGSTGISAKIGDVIAAVNGNVIAVPALDAGTYNLTVTTVPDANHNAVTKTATVTVNKVVPTISVNVDDAKVGENVTFVVSLPDDATGAVSLIVDKTYNLTIKNGKASMTLDSLAYGNYAVVASYDGDAKYLAGNATADLTISLNEISIGITADEITVGETAHIVFTFPEDATGLLSTAIGGSIHSSSCSGGIFEYDMTPATAGNFTITADFLGDNKYATKSFTGVLSVKPAKPTISIDLPQIRVGETTTLTVTLPSDASGYIFVNLPGSTKTKYTNDGIATFDLESYADPGNYTVSIRYAGNDKYMEAETTAIFIIKPKLVNANVDISAEDIYAGDNQTIAVSLPSDATGTINIKVNDKEYTETLVDGKASFTISDLAAGSYEISLTYLGDDKYNSTTKTKTFNVLKLLDPELRVAVSDIVISQNAIITATVNEEVSGTVTIIVDGTSYTANIISGKATLSVSGLSAGNHTVIVIFNGEGIFDASQSEVSFNVIKYNVRLVASPVTMTYKDGSSFKVRVFGEDGVAVGAGKSVTIKVGSTTKVVKTDKNGYATLKLTKIPGTYNIVTTYNGVSVTKKLTVKHLLTLKSVTVKKSAKKLVLQATLGKLNGKYLKNKAITFKFNGKTYKKVNGKAIKTNAKGVAKLTISSSVLKKLKVGKKVTYEATYVKDTVKKTTKVKK